MNWLLLSGGIDLFSPYMLIIQASAILILSHLFGILAEKTNVPSVLMLILTGILIKVGLDAAHVEAFDLMPALELLGIVGLIMIVLEAALDLELKKEKLPLIGKSLLISFVALIGSVLLIAVVFQQFLGMNFLLAMLYATPLSIMSSAIIIPSVNNLIPSKKEFMIYESTFSDIVGIMFFYFIISLMESGGASAAAQFAVSLVLTVIVAVVASYLLVFLFKDMKGHTRLFLLIAVLLMLYAAGKLMHLSPLLIILIFGLSLANHQTFFKVFKNTWAKGDDPIERIEKEFHLITLETAFVVRTFFFVIFGMTIDLSTLLNFEVFLISGLVLAILYIVRIIALRAFQGKDFLPELFIAPRGLITILLFFAIPATYTVESFNKGILLYVIIISALVMTFALISDSKNKPKTEAVEADHGH